MHFETSWIVFVKEMVTVLAVTPVILILILSGRYRLPALKWVLYIFTGGILCELIGVRLHVEAFALIGIVISVPLIQSANFVFSSLLGRMFLKEKISRRCLAAMLILIVSMIFLTFGPQSALQQLTWKLIFVGLGAVVAGLMYSIHIVFLRFTSESKQMPVTLIMVQVTAIGATIFGVEIWYTHGWDGFYRSIPLEAWGWALFSGFTNMIGFCFQILGLRYTIVARAQMISVAQIVFVTILGILYFAEPTNFFVWLGIAMTISGILLVSFPEKGERLGNTSTA